MTAPVTRRVFLGAALTTGAAAAGLATGLTGSAASAAGTPVADPWRAGVFRQLVGQRLAVEGGGSLRVVAVREHAAGAPGEAFTVVLEASGVDTSSSLFTVRHPALGTVLLAATTSGSRLAAVVDRRRPPTSTRET